MQRQQRLGRLSLTYRDTLASNAEEFQRLARMVSDMLFLAKTERGVDLPHKEVFSARKEAQALLDFYEAVAEEKASRSPCLKCTGVDFPNSSPSRDHA